MATTYDTLPAVIDEIKRDQKTIMELLAKIGQPAPSLADYVTRGQACKLLDITYPTLSAWCKRGKLTLHHVGGRSYLKESEVLALIKPVNYSLENA